LPKGDKYIGLANYLKNKKENVVTLFFHEIENLVGDKLPESAYRHRAFWSNTHSHSVAFGWLDAGFKTISIDFNKQLVKFERK